MRTIVIGPPALRAEVIRALPGERGELCELDCLEAVPDDPPGPATVMLLDDRTGPSLAGALASLSERLPEAHVVLVRSSAHGWEIRCALAAGAAGIVRRQDVATALGPCVRAVQAGQICVPCGGARAIGRPVLSVREKQILGLVVMGLMNSEIAERLFLAESTVKSHLSSAFAKLEVHSRNEAVEAILDPLGGLSTGILALGGEPLGGDPLGEGRRSGAPLGARCLTNGYPGTT